MSLSHFPKCNDHITDNNYDDSYPRAAVVLAESPGRSDSFDFFGRAEETGVSLTYS